MTSNTIRLSALLGVVAMASASVLTSCGGGDVQQQGQQVTVRITGGDAQSPKLVRLEVRSDQIIRVSATAEQKFRDPKSLIVVPQEQQTPYELQQRGDTVCVKTASVMANVLKTTGQVWFTDLEGNVILAEQAESGKTFQPYECQQTVWTANADGPAEQANPTRYSGWTTRVIFESPEDEAFYGLGQHQADDWNYKGKNEELFQYNTKVSIPFIVSSHGYGVLVDSYSLMRFGNPHDYSQLGELFDLIDREGNPGALTGTYTAPGQETLTRREDSIYFENLKSAKNLPAYDLNKATVLYEGEIVPRESGEYCFSHYYSGYQKIFIDDQDVYTEDVMGHNGSALQPLDPADNATQQTIWRTAWNPNARKFRLQLNAGQHYRFRLEWQPDGGEAYCGLRALAPVAKEEQQKLSFWSEMTQQLDYYFIYGGASDDNGARCTMNDARLNDSDDAGDSRASCIVNREPSLDRVIAGYRQLTGKAQIMPKWLLGYWQSRERYKTQREILDALQGFRDRKLPIDNIVMDWNYWTWDSWGGFEFDPERFSDPKGMIDTIHQQHAKIMISCWPKYYLTTEHFKELNDMGKMYQQSIKDSIYDWLGYKYAFYDAYDYDARRVFWRQLYEHLGTIGMDAWWMDASEPNVRDCTDLPYRKLLCGPTAFGSSDEFFNAYSIVNAEAIYDGQRGYETAIERQGIKADDSQALQAGAQWNQDGYGNEGQFSPENRRVFLLTRNGFAAEQRFSTATWSGDIGTRWEDMKTQITAGLNFSISGVPFWSQDIGGFSVEKRYEAAQRLFDQTGKENEDLRDWRELNVRWHEWGVFTPMYRTHGQFPLREPWNVAPQNHPAYRTIQSLLEFRYRMMPYLYSLAAQVHFDDYTMLRPMVMDFGYDTQVLDLGYQFMCGPSFMVCPVYQYKARQRDVYFPKDRVWYDLYTGRVASQGGEQKACPAPYEQIPVFVPSGSIIPFGPALQYVDEKPADVIRLYVYEGRDGQFTLYEDEGTNYGYEAGRYANIRFTYSEEAHELTIADREGEFPGMLQSRTFVIVPVSADHVQPYDPEAKGIEVQYDGKAVSVKL